MLSCRSGANALLKECLMSESGFPSKNLPFAVTISTETKHTKGEDNFSGGYADDRLQPHLSLARHSCSLD